MFETGDELKLKNGTLEKDDPILEMLQLEKDIQVNREEKEADEKEKARRLERKRKAAMFLKLKSATKSPSRETKPSYSPSQSRRSSDDSVIIVRWVWFHLVLYWFIKQLRLDQGVQQERKAGQKKSRRHETKVGQSQWVVPVVDRGREKDIEPALQKIEKEAKADSDTKTKRRKRTKRKNLIKG